MLLYCCPTSLSLHSKKGLPLPPVLPPPLKNFLLAAPAVPPTLPTAGLPPVAPGTAPHAVPQVTVPPVPAAGSGFTPSVSPAAAAVAQKAPISSAFDFESPAPDMPLPGHMATTQQAARRPSADAAGFAAATGAGVGAGMTPIKAAPSVGPSSAVAEVR